MGKAIQNLPRERKSCTNNALIEGEGTHWVRRAQSLETETPSSSSNLAAYYLCGFGTSLHFSFRICKMGATSVKSFVGIYTWEKLYTEKEGPLGQRVYESCLKSVH